MSRSSATTAASRAVVAAAALAAATAAMAAGGAIEGKVDATPPKYLGETVVYVKQAGPAQAPKTFSMDQRNMTFLPHVLAVAKGDTVNFLNHDGVAHNVYSPDNEGFNLGAFKKDESRPHVFDKEGAYSLLCSIHPEMLGYVFVGPSRHAAVVDAKGHYQIQDVPPGTYKLAVWNSHLKAPEKTVTVVEGKPVEADFSLKR